MSDRTESGWEDDAAAISINDNRLTDLTPLTAGKDHSAARLFRGFSSRDSSILITPHP